jgi:cell fate regulator YaaT (PSP1 superfamily)
MHGFHLIRVGALGQVGRFASAEQVRYPRASEVVLRTTRGLELGEVLAAPEGPAHGASEDGTILRAVTEQDRLLRQRLEKNRHAAYQACAAMLADRKLPATLIDVEHLFDGQSLIFYFLGEVTPELAAYTSELAEAYEAQAQFRRFTETLTAGCGPDCGTGEADGCTACGTGCAIAGACGSTRR